MSQIGEAIFTVSADAYAHAKAIAERAAGDAAGPVREALLRLARVYGRLSEHGKKLAEKHRG